MNEPIRIEDIRALYGWFEENELDIRLGEAPTDWFALSKEIANRARRKTPPASTPRQTAPGPHPARPAPPPARPRAPVQAPAQPPDEAIMAARESAGGAADLDDLHARLAAFDGCRLKLTAKSLCFYRGAGTAPLMVIGEAPGRDEDIQGRPFVGRAGQLLDRMLAAIGITETDVHITNIVYWRPPGNRNPTPEEAQICLPFVERQIQLVAPRVLFLLGRPASNHLMKTTEGIMKLRGKWRTLAFGDFSVPALASLHPAYLLRTPAAKRMAWRDLLSLQDALEREDPP